MFIEEIVEYLCSIGTDAIVYGNKDFKIETFCSIKDIKPNAITFIRDIASINLDKIITQKNVLVICERKIEADFTQICVKNPHRTFFKIIEKFFYRRKYLNVPEKAVIQTESIGENLMVGPFSFIDEEVMIGSNCIIGDNVTIEGKVRIGNDVIIESGARIGTWGFGHYLNDDGTNSMIPHLGGVIIGDHSFVGANTIISRGTLSDTIIGENVLIDGLCYIAHNAKIGDRVMIAGGAGVAGSAVIGADSWISPRCVINAGTSIGTNCFIGINGIVTKDIPDNQYATGIPAKVIKENNDKKYKI